MMSRPTILPNDIALHHDHKISSNQILGVGGVVEGHSVSNQKVVDSSPGIV